MIETNATRTATIQEARTEWSKARPGTAMAILARAGSDMVDRRAILRAWGVSFDDQIDYSSDRFLADAGFGPDGEELEPAVNVVELGRDAGLTPFVWDNAQLNGSTWVETDPAEGGERVPCSAVRTPYCDETPQYFEVPVATWGDYVGSAVERSNYRSMLRDYPETFVEVFWGHGGHSLLLPVSSLLASDEPEDLVNLLTGLREQYPLYDEEDHSELETELADEAWDAWARFDLLRELRDAGVSDDVVDAIDETELRERFYGAVWASDEYPYAESADSIVFPMWDDVVETLAAQYGA